MEEKKCVRSIVFLGLLIIISMVLAACTTPTTAPTTAPVATEVPTAVVEQPTEAAPHRGSSG